MAAKEASIAGGGLRPRRRWQHSRERDARRVAAWRCETERGRAGRPVQTSVGLGRSHHWRARHWSGEEALVAGRRVERSPRLASRRQESAGPVGHLESRKVCLALVTYPAAMKSQGKIGRAHV